MEEDRVKKAAQEEIIKKIENLQMEIKAMQIDPLLKDHYSEKVMELIRLRGSLIRLNKRH